jgi:hypothetical protein
VHQALGGSKKATAALVVGPVVASESEAIQMEFPKKVQSIRCISIIITNWIASLPLAMTIKKGGLEAAF